MDVQEAPLNLSCRGTSPRPIKQEVDLSVSSPGQWNALRNPVLMSRPMPWCFPTLTTGYPPLAISAEQSLQYQSVYWSFVRNLLQQSLKGTESREGNVSVPPATAQKQAYETGNPPSHEFSNTSDTSETDQAEQSQRPRPKKASSPGKPSFECQQCGVSYPHRFELNRHVKVSHIRPHRCDHCGKGFGHKNYLQVHIETVHLGRKMHKCDLCGKYLSTGGNLSVHVRTIHMGEKKYKCSICSRTFGQQCNMKTHMKRHLCKQEEKRSARIKSF